MNPMKLLGFATTVLFQTLVILSGLWTAPIGLAAQPRPKAAIAPPLHACEVTATTDLGLWDDVFVAQDQDFIVLRRGAELFSLTMAASATPRKIAKTPAADKTQIIAGAAVGDKFWLFLNSSTAASCALDAYSGTVATFEIPGLTVPGSHAPGIQSCDIVPHAQAALLLVASGDRAACYFWMDLKSGKVVRFPSGWDLDYFSADERIAVFAKPLEKQFARRPLQAVAMRTGERIETLPDRRKERCIPFDWTYQQKVKPLYEWRAGQGAANYFAGLSVGGFVVPLALGLEDVQYVSQAKASDGFAGFRLRREGAWYGAPSPLRIVPFQDPQKMELVATGVTDFTMLGQGNAVFVAVADGGKHPLRENRYHAEAYFRAHGDKSSWNVLAGVERLPKLDKVFADASYVMDRFTIRLIEGFGTSRHEPLAVCVCEHHRRDERSVSIPFDKKVLKAVTWRRALVVTGGGRRFLMPLFREGHLPDEVWLHKSAILITGTYVWHESASGRKRQLQLTEITLQKP